MDSLFFLMFFVVVGTLIVRAIRYGGVTGMMLGARSQEKLGMIEGKAAGRRRINLVVHRLDGQHPVGLHFTGYATASVERLAASLSREDTRRLADALETAASERDAS
jgi:hypothetical protein